MVTRRVVLATIPVLLAIFAGCGSSSSAARHSVGAPASTTQRAPTAPAKPTLPTYWDPGSFAASPTEVEIGHEVTFTGGGCPVGASGQVVSPIASEPQTVGADRTWSATVVIPDNSQVGAVPAYATCETTPESATAYTPITLNVTTPQHLEVRPAGAVRPGTTLNVTAIGTCPGSPGNSVVVELLDDKHGATDDVSVPLVVGGDGNWSGPVVVPGDLAPGSYVLSAACSGFRTFAAGYTSYAFDVSR